MKKLKRNGRPPSMKEGRSKQTKALSPAPDPLNASRVRWAAAALEELQRQTGADLGDAVSDLLADLMHWCDRFGQSFPKELHRALSHYEEETDASSATTALLSQYL